MTSRIYIYRDQACTDMVGQPLLLNDSDDFIIDGQTQEKIYMTPINGIRVKNAYIGRYSEDIILINVEVNLPQITVSWSVDGYSDTKTVSADGVYEFIGSDNSIIELEITNFSSIPASASGKYGFNKYFWGYEKLPSDVLKNVSMTNAFRGSVSIIPLYVKNVSKVAISAAQIRFECESGFWNYHDGTEFNIFNIYGSKDGENFDIHYYRKLSNKDRNRSVIEFNFSNIEPGEVIPIWIKQENIGDKVTKGYEVNYEVATPSQAMESSITVLDPYISVDSNNEYNVSYHCFIDDVEVPITSFSAVKRKYGERSSLTIKPTPDIDINLLVANALIRIKRKYLTKDGTEQIDSILLGKIESAPIYTVGPDGTSVSVTGHYEYGDVSSRRVIHLNKIIERTNDATGKVKLKVPLNNYPVVKDIIYYNDAQYTMEQIEFYVNDSVNYMEVTCGSEI